MTSKPSSVAAAALLSLSLALCACTTPSSNTAADAPGANGGAERSYTDEELQSHDGSGFFPTTFTFEELMEDHNCQPGSDVEGAYTEGAYVVGAPGAPAAGLYRLAGQEDETGDLTVYMPADEEGRFRADYALSYLGSMLVELHEGDAIFFKPALELDLMRPADPAPIDASAPYESGLYRVGVDIPAGTYTVTQSPLGAAAIAAQAYAHPQVIVYSSLDFSEDGTISEEDLPDLQEGPVSVVVTVEDGQFLELYGAVANPQEA